MQTPISAISAPTMSNLSGGILSICQPHNIAITMKIPPYAAYTLPKCAGWKVGTMPKK